MLVRPARQDDLPAIEEILRACGLAVEGVDYTEWTGWLLVAERQSQVIGMIHIIPSRPYAVIAEFAVLPAFQKSRAAHKLIEAAELLMRTTGTKVWAAFVGANRNGFHATVEAWGARSTGHGQAYWRTL